MMNIIKYAPNLLIIAILTACGGGGDGGGTPVNTPTATYVSLIVNKDGLYRTAPFATSTNYVKNTSTGYFVTTYINQEWTGAGMSYSEGYVNPTSGRLYSYKITDRTNSELWYSINDLNYDISATPASNDSSRLPLDALYSASETRIYGGDNNDKTPYLISTSEVDLGRGLDTLVHSQNYSSYTFMKVSGSNTSLIVTRNGHSSTVKNVELFEFANITKTFSEIYNSIP